LPFLVLCLCVFFAAYYAHMPALCYHSRVCIEGCIDLIGCTQVTRDKNHPSIVMWSLANEPMSQYSGAVQYFRTLYQYLRSIDPNRNHRLPCHKTM
jgi:hypothetical protein